MNLENGLNIVSYLAKLDRCKARPRDASCLNINKPLIPGFFALLIFLNTLHLII